MLTRTVGRKRLGFVCGAFVVGAGVLGVGLAACGGDDTVSPPAEAGSDGTTHVEAGGDTGTPDVVMPLEAAPDSEADAGEAGVPDAGMDAPPQFDAAALEQYPHAVDVAYCQRVQQCCLVPADQWDVPGCANLLDTYGGALRTGVYASAFDGGGVAFDPAKASTCFGEIAAFNCGIFPAAAFSTAVTDCNAAIVGTIGVDAGGCTSSVQCTTGAYCDRPSAADAGPGNCVPLQGSGGSCTNPNSEQCTYLGNGQPQLYCNIQGDSGTGQCTGAKGVDAGCATNAECLSGLCGGTCLSQTVFSDPGVAGGFCDHFTIKDAGGEGG